MPVTMKVRRDAAKAGGFPKGMHRAILSNVDMHETKNSVSVRLTFSNRMMTIDEDLWDTEKAAARMTLFARRLGILSKDATADVEEEEVDFEKAVGTEFVIDVDYQLDRNDQSVARLTYAGLWPLDHEDKKVKEFLASPAGQTPASLSAEAAKTVTNVDDI